MKEFDITVLGIHTDYGDLSLPKSIRTAVDEYCKGLYDIMKILGFKNYVNVSRVDFADEVINQFEDETSSCGYTYFDTLIVTHSLRLQTMMIVMDDSYVGGALYDAISNEVIINPAYRPREELPFIRQVSKDMLYKIFRENYILVSRKLHNSFKNMV